MLSWLVRIDTSVRARLQRQDRDERGQATMEYAMVIITVIVLVAVIAKFMNEGEGENAITGLFSDVIGWAGGGISKIKNWFK